MFGSGEYVADATEGIVRVEDLPKPHQKKRTRNRKSAPCPICRRRSLRRRTNQRVLHDLGNRETGRPVEVEYFFSIHRCTHCQKYFGVDLSDAAVPGSLYTIRVIELAVRIVVEDGLPYREASWHLWRDHRVFVPFATIQNRVEASGKKNPHED